MRRELHLTDDQRLTNIMAYYAIRDTVYAWLDGGQESDLTDIPDATDTLGERRAFTVSDRPYKAKKSLKIRQNHRKAEP